VSGLVFDASTGEPLRDVVVLLGSNGCKSWFYRDSELSVVTDEHGRFRVLWSDDDPLLNDVDCDQLLARFEEDRHYSVERTVALHPSTAVDLRVRLPHRPCPVEERW
jgi:hypothetical protein